jgi:molybdopterin converting factor small subunit
MKIKLKLVASLQENRFDTRILEYPQEISANRVIADIGLAENGEIVVLVNGVHSGRDTPLSDRDTLTLMPFVDGG